MIELADLTTTLRGRALERQPWSEIGCDRWPAGDTVNLSGAIR